MKLQPPHQGLGELYLSLLFAQQHAVDLQDVFLSSAEAPPAFPRVLAASKQCLHCQAWECLASSSHQDWYCAPRCSSFAVSHDAERSHY